MKWFLCGVAAALTALVVVMLCFDDSIHAYNARRTGVVLGLGLAPFLAACSAAVLARFIRIPDWRTRTRFSVRACVAGVIITSIGLGAGVIWMLLRRQQYAVPDEPLSITVCIGCSTFISAIVGKRTPDGACRACGYDLRGLALSASHCCPECGSSDPAPA